MKRYLVLFVILAIVSSFCACGKVSEKNNEPEASATQSQGESTSEYKTTLYTEFDTSCVKKLGEYKNRTIEKDLSVDDASLIAAYSDILKQFLDVSVDGGDPDETAIEAKNAIDGMCIKKGVVKKLDVISFDYEGKLDGVAFDGGTASGTIAVMGMGTFIPGFEEQIIGHDVGTTFDINVTFPEQYTAELANKEVVFTIKVNFILPAISEETVAFINKYTGTDYKDVEDFKNHIKSELKSEHEAEFESGFLSRALQIIYNESEFNELPKSEIEKLRAYYDSIAKSYNYDLNTYISLAFGFSGEEEFTEYLKYNVSIYAVIASILKNENINVSDNEFNAKMEELRVQYGYEDIASLENAVDTASVKNNMLLEKLNDFLLNNWKVEVVEND